MSSSTQGSQKERKVLVVDDFRELTEAEFAEYEQHWNTRNVSFVRYKSTAEDGPKTREDALKQLQKLDKEQGPFSALISAGGFLHRFKPVNEEWVKCFQDLRFCGGMGAGYDNIDTKALSSCGVYYSNTPESVSIPTADSASVLILTTLKNTIQGDRSVRSGKWASGVGPGLNPKGAVIGILGMGSIGQITCKQMQAFGSKVIYHNRNKLPEEKAAGATYVSSLPDFLSQCDVVSVHVPLSDATRHLISTEEFKHFKDGARIVNTARGPVVDEEALVQALKSGKLSGAGLDVFEEEPKVHPELLKMDNVLMQPHTGSNTIGTLAETTREMLGNLASFLTVRDGEAPRNAVNELDKEQLTIKLRVRGEA